MHLVTPGYVWLILSSISLTSAWVVVALIAMAFWQRVALCWLAAILIRAKKIYIHIFMLCCLLSLRCHFLHAQHF